MFGFTEEQKFHQSKVREFDKNWIAPNLDEIDAGKCCPDFIWEEWIKEGYASPCAPKFTGGPEMSFSTCLTIWEELGRADVGCATGFGVNNLGSFPVLLGGNDEQKKEHFGKLLTGKYGSFGLTEKGAGSDAGAVATEAKKVGDKYVLNGDKCYITQSGRAIDTASSLILVASTDKSLGSKGLTAFLVPGDTPGLTYTKEEDKMGIRGSQTCELHLEDVTLDESRIISKVGDGFKLAMMTLDAGRAVVAAQACGIAQATLDVALDYVKNQLDGGRPLAKQKAIAFKLAELEAALQVGRTMIYKIGEMRDAGEKHGHYSCIAKLYCTDMAVNTTREVMDMMGVNGYAKGSKIEKLYRDARILPIYEGTNQIQRLVISGTLLGK